MTTETNNLAFLALLNDARAVDKGPLRKLDEIAERCGVTRYHLWRIVHRGCVPSEPTRRRLAKGLRVARSEIDACFSDR